MCETDDPGLDAFVALATEEGDEPFERITSEGAVSDVGERAGRCEGCLSQVAVRGRRGLWHSLWRGRNSIASDSSERLAAVGTIDSALGPA
jgi:hypothetical protein